MNIFHGLVKAYVFMLLLLPCVIISHSYDFNMGEVTIVNGTLHMRVWPPYEALS